MNARAVLIVHITCITILGATYLATPGYGAFDLDGEGNVPTWFSSAGLLACGLVAFLLRRRARGLTAFAFLLSAAAVDEVAMFHERAAAWLLEHRGDVPPITVWLLGAVLAAALAATLVPMLRRLPPVLRTRLVVSGVVFVAAAVGVETLGQAWARRHGWHNAVYTFLVLLEECGEMLGAALCLRALLAWREGSRDRFIRSVARTRWRRRR
ncbi:MAG: hypothetical protein HOO96_02100 [Polyangiaceae bacterium]|nr:hypothetical protein [Polyangiaceae bacterium]